MIEYLWDLLKEYADYVGANFDPFRDTLDVLLVTLGIYWVLLLIRGTRAVQILVGLIVLIALSLGSEIFQLVTVRLILENFLGSAVIIIVVLFQHDIRRALARVGRGFFPSSVSAQQESEMLDELVRATRSLASRRIGALIVLERDTSLNDQIEAGTSLDAVVSKEMLTSVFQSQSPLHDGAVLIRQGRIASAGCILPLTVKEDLPEGVGTRHRAAVGITEETDATVIVVSEETGSISVVMRGDMIHDLDPSRLRLLLADILTGERSDLQPRRESGEEADETEPVSKEASVDAPDTVRARTAG